MSSASSSLIHLLRQLRQPRAVSAPSIMLFCAVAETFSVDPSNIDAWLGPSISYVSIGNIGACLRPWHVPDLATSAHASSWWLDYINPPSIVSPSSTTSSTTLTASTSASPPSTTSSSMHFCPCQLFFPIWSSTTLPLWGDVRVNENSTIFSTHVGVSAMYSV
jgi:hypothetical protein